MAYKRKTVSRSKASAKTKASTKETNQDDFLVMSPSMHFSMLEGLGWIIDPVTPIKEYTLSDEAIASRKSYSKDLRPNWVRICLINISADEQRSSIKQQLRAGELSPLDAQKLLKDLQWSQGVIPKRSCQEGQYDLEAMKELLDESLVEEDDILTIDDETFVVMTRLTDEYMLASHQYYNEKTLSLQEWADVVIKSAFLAPKKEYRARLMNTPKPKAKGNGVSLEEHKANLKARAMSGLDLDSI